MTPRRLRVLRYIQSYRQKHGVSPTLSEIADALDVAVSNIHFHLTKLKNQGYLDWSTKRRSIVLYERESEMLRQARANFRINLENWFRGKGHATNRAFIPGMEKHSKSHTKYEG